MFRIAIIGGGLGGLFTALAIKYHCPQGVQIDVYEQAAEYTEIGAGVGIGPNAAVLIQKIGLLEEALMISGNRRDVWLSFLRYDTGEEIMTVKTPEKGNRVQLSMHRAEFLHLLVQAIRSRGAAILHTNMRCEKLEDKGATMLVTFTNGKTASANLVLGADGIHSVQDTARYGEMVIYRGLCPIADIQNDWPYSTYATSWVAPGKHFLTFPISRNNTLNVVAFVTTPWEEIGNKTTRESWTQVGDKETIKQEFKDFAAPVQAAIDKMNTNPLKWLLFDRMTPSQWVFSGGKVALLGDAAHAMCPHQGAGAGQALEDGYVIGRALKDYFQSMRTDGNGPSLQSALEVYQSIRYPRSERVQATSRQAGDAYQMKAPELAGLSYEDGLPILTTMLENRMQWIWTEDIDNVYETAVAAQSRL
ncbi:uncharacterized protein TRUGW13939_02047 [Talaromyces rugulosus]|uniref:FAD-binding domain-containing protein n=1 Tax=Talaromyces rugulosus TaxID=121627 RepID=A0A7H8QLZ3_TALRU|nr:uncharacterized protein TRUGW13939_02047 [Talaromyces rugulosus]QKX54957.1 hypothetical protein TRUGW13939_02047 [Talaromyces rugulosus]